MLKYVCSMIELVKIIICFPCSSTKQYMYKIPSPGDHQNSKKLVTGKRYQDKSGLRHRKFYFR